MEEVIVPEVIGKSILFLNVPLHGHVNPTLDLVAELVKRGNVVTYYSADSFKEKIVAIGAIPLTYGAAHIFTTSREVANIFRTSREMLVAAEKILDTLAGPLASTKIDLILYDVSAVWGKFLGYILKVPSVCCFPGFAPQWKGYVKSRTIITRGITDGVEGFWDLQETRQIRDRIITKFNIPKISSGSLFSGSDLLNIVFTSPYLQPYSEEMTQNFQFISPILQARKETVSFSFEVLNPNHKLIYISMGTLYQPPPSFFKICFTAFGYTPFDVIVSVGKGTIITSLEPIPYNIFVKNYVPQLEVLEKTDVFVSHGGMGGVNEAMFFGVPMLILPKTIEQQVNGRRMEELGAGIDLKTQDVTPDMLFDGVSRLLEDGRYKEGAKRIQNSFLGSKGVEPVVDTLEKLLRKKK